MEIHEIRYFLSVADELNFTRAAKVCHVSQPALTRGIKSLEDKLAAGPLVHRERANTHLTELGRMMQPYFHRIVQQMETAKETANRYISLSGTTLRLGLMSTIGPSALVDPLVDYRTRYHGVQIEIIDETAEALEDRLERGDLDVAIYSRPEAEYAEKFHTIPLFSERFVVLVPPNHRLAGQDAIRMRDLNGENYLGRRACEFYEHLRRIRLKLGDVEFERPYSSDRDDWVQSMVLAGLGFTYCPEYAVMMPGVVVRPLVDPEVQREVSLTTVRGRPHSPAVGAFVEAARRYPWKQRLAAASPRSTTETDNE